MFILNALALFVFGTLVGNEIAVGFFVHPALYRLEETQHRATARLLAGVFGRVAPPWYIVSALLLIAVAGVTLVPLAILAALIVLIVIAWTVLRLAPLNKKISEWNLASPPPDWLEQRQRWDRWHRRRVIALGFAFLCLCFVVAVLQK